jgi:hypothetical protein
MDRFELAEHWWEAIYADPAYDTENRFDRWRSKAENGCRGVIWAAPGESGRLEEPALARIVVWSARGFRAGVWSLFLPNPSWSAPAREAYMKARMAGDRDWKQLTRKPETLTGDPDTSQQHLADGSWPGGRVTRLVKVAHAASHGTAWQQPMCMHSDCRYKIPGACWANAADDRCNHRVLTDRPTWRTDSVFARSSEDPSLRPEQAAACARVVGAGGVPDLLTITAGWGLALDRG